jgi:acetyl-CoA acetyltransferase
MDLYGTTQRQLAVIAAKNHFHASLNPKAQYTQDLTVEQVLLDSKVSYPLTRAMCAPIGDGAAAAILCSGDTLGRIGRARAVRIRASVLGSGSNRGLEEEDIAVRLAAQAYRQAAVGPKDISVAELHDASAFGELHHCETLGFCGEGEGGPFAETGATQLGGRIPMNTSGGLESRGHPVGATGLAQVYELVTQLRGEAGQRQVEGARIALAQNGGGMIGIEEAAMCLHVLEAPGRQ